MAPKPLHKLGGVQPHGNGWRAVVQLKHGDECCPVRAIRCAADADLTRMRGAHSREEIPRIAREIRETAWQLAATRPAEVGTPSEPPRAAASATSVFAASPHEASSTLEPSPSANGADGARETKVYNGLNCASAWAHLATKHVNIKSQYHVTATTKDHDRHRYPPPFTATEIYTVLLPLSSS